MVAVVINLTYGIAALLRGLLRCRSLEPYGSRHACGIRQPALRLKVGLNFFTWTMLLKRIMGVSVSLYALGVLLTATSADGLAIIPISVETAIIIFGAIVVLYTMQGGLWAVLMTDVLQFIVLTVVVFIVAVLMMTDVGSVSNFLESTPDSFLRPTGESTRGSFYSVGPPSTSSRSAPNGPLSNGSLPSEAPRMRASRPISLA